MRRARIGSRSALVAIALLAPWRPAAQEAGTEQEQRQVTNDSVPSVADAPSGPPEADLTVVFVDWPAWERSADALEAAVVRFGSFRDEQWGSPGDLLAVLQAEDEVRRLAARVDGYLGLRLAFDRSEVEALAHRPRMAAISARWDGASSWLEPRLLALGLDRTEAWLAVEPRLVPYRWRLRRAARGTPRPLSERELELLSLVDLERSAAADVYTALTVAEAPVVRVELPSGRSLEIGPALGRNLAAEIADAADRRAARRAWLEALAAHAGTAAELLAGVVRRERFAAVQRGFHGSLAASFHEEGVAERLVLGMLAAARDGAPAVARWHAVRRRRLGIDRYGVADVRAPLTGARTDFTWAEARAELAEAVEPLGPEAAAVLRRAFDQRWIDAVERPRKQAGGFSTFVYGDRPFVSVVFRGTTTDLVRLAHELGHAIHHQLAFEAQPFGPSRPSILVGETVAAVHELLLARVLARRARTPDERAAALDLEAQLIHRGLVATAQDADFEVAVHAEQGALTATRLGELYRERLVTFHGGALDLDEVDGKGWLEVPHFFTVPFGMARYGLSFAAAARLVEGLLDPDPARAAEARRRYLALLGAGGSEAPLALLRVAGADLESAQTVEAVARRLAALAAALEAEPVPVPAARD